MLYLSVKSKPVQFVSVLLGIFLINFIASDIQEVISRVSYTYQHSTILKLLIYFSTYLLSIIALIVLTLIKNRIIYLLFICFNFTTLLVQVIFVKMGHNFNENDAGLVLREYAYAGDAFVTFLPMIFSMLVFSIILQVSYHLLRAKVKIRLSYK